MSAPRGPTGSTVPSSSARGPPPILRRPSSVSSSSFASTATSSFAEASSDSNSSSSSDDDSDGAQTEGYWSSSGLSGDDSRLLSRLDHSLQGPGHGVQPSTARTTSPVARSNLRLSLAVLRARQSLASHSYDALAAALKALSAALPALPALTRRPTPGADNPLGVFVPTLARLAGDVRAALCDEAERGREFRRTKLAREDAKALVGLRQRWSACGGVAGGKGKGRETDSLEWVGVVEASVAQNPPPDFLDEPAFATLTPALLTSLEAFLLPSSLPRLSLSSLGITDTELAGWPALIGFQDVAQWYFSFVVGQPEDARLRARKALDGVKSLDLSKNKLMTFPLYLCRLFPHLETLSLSHNQFPHLPPWVTLFSSLRRLRTHGNRLVSARKALAPLDRPHTSRRVSSGTEGAGSKHGGTRADVRDVLAAVRATVVDASLDELLPLPQGNRARSLFSLVAEVVHAQLELSSALAEDAATFLPPHVLDALLASYMCASCQRFVLPSAAVHVPAFTERVHHLDPGISLPARLPPPVLPLVPADPAAPTPPVPRAFLLSAAERPATLEQRLLLALLARLDVPPSPRPRMHGARRGSVASLSSLTSAHQQQQQRQQHPGPPRRRRHDSARDRPPVLPTLVLGGAGAQKADWRFCALCAAAHLGLEDALARRARAGALSAATQHRAPALAADPMSSRVDVINTDAGRILCVADIRGAISTLNTLAAQHSAVAVIHSGDFGFFEPTSLSTMSDRTLKHLVQYSSLITPQFRAQLLSPNTTPALIRELLANPPKNAFPAPADQPSFALSEFPKLLSGELKLNVPVYTVWGACEDVAILEKIRLAPPSAQSIPVDPSKVAPAPPNASTRPSSIPATPPSYAIPNLTVLDEATTRVLLIGGVRLRLFGLGGAVVPHKLFDNGAGTATIAGGQGTMWTTMLQIGELVDTAQKVYDPSETRLLVSHASPGREGLLSQLALVLKADLTVSAGLHFRYGVSYNEFSVQHDPDAFRAKLEASKKSFNDVWEAVRSQVEGVVDENQRTLLQNALAVANRIPASNLVAGAAAIEETAWKNCWNWNLPDAAYGSLVLDIREGRIGSEIKSQGFNFAYRQNTPRPPTAAPSSSPAPPTAAAIRQPTAPSPAPSASTLFAGGAGAGRGGFANGPSARSTPGPGPGVGAGVGVIGNHPRAGPQAGPRGGGGGGGARGGFAAPGGWGHAGAQAVAAAQVINAQAQTPGKETSEKSPAQPRAPHQQGQGRGNRAQPPHQQQQAAPTAAAAVDASGTPAAPVASAKKSDAASSGADAVAAESSGAEGATPASPATPTGAEGATPGAGGRGGKSRRERGPGRTKGRSNGEWTRGSSAQGKGEGKGDGQGKSGGGKGGAKGEGAGGEGKSPAPAPPAASGGNGSA
ncbi:hypothetical protein JCM3770_004837 [Rhodotorula araucariae]